MPKLRPESTNLTTSMLVTDIGDRFRRFVTKILCLLKLSHQHGAVTHITVAGPTGISTYFV